MADFVKTARQLSNAARKHESILVSFSGGKDSLACLDLCCRAFRRVVPFYMFVAPNLQFMQQRFDWVKERYGLTVLQFPHWLVYKYLRHGIYCPVYFKNEVPEIKLFDVYEMVMQETGIRCICHGGKDADGLWRRRQFANMNADKWAHMLYPIKGWSKYDVMQYLESHKIPVPSESAENSRAGVDLSTPTLLWLHDTFPEDFKRLCEFYPYAEAAVWRRTYYGNAQ